jgi:hypothetical protein
MLTPQQIQDIRGRYSIDPQTVDKIRSVQTTPSNDTSILDRAWSNTPDQTQETGVPILPGQKTVQSFATGVAKGGVSTVTGLVKLGKKIATGIGGLFGVKEAGNTEPIISGMEKASTPTGTAENIGFGAEKLAEFFIPASKAAKAESAINVLTKGIESPLLRASARIIGKSAVQGTAAGEVRLAQTGSPKEAAITAATAGVIRGGLATIGEGARALHLPERLYSTIFKNSAQDMISELKSGGLAKLQETNPQKLQQFIDKGIVKINPDGSPLLNDTLAEKAIENGLRGSIRNMANTVVEGTLDSENSAQTIANSYKGTINLAEPQIKNVLKEISSEYENVGFGDISNEAGRLAQSITDGGGNVSAGDALAIRRLLDKARIARSFDVQASKLSLSQQNLKTLADAVRQRVNNIPGMGDVMKKYSFYIDAMDALGQEAKRRGNNQVLSLIDSLFLSGAYAGNNPIPGITMGMLRKIVMSAPGTTALGQLFNKSSVSPLSSGLISSGSSGVQSALTGQ